MDPTAAMASTWVIRLSQDDKQRTPILLNVSQKEGAHDLDIDLLATDGEAAFVAKGEFDVGIFPLMQAKTVVVRQRSLKKSRAKNFDGSDDDWNNIVSSVLNPLIKLSGSGQRKDNLDVTCSVTGRDPKRSLAIAFSNKVEDITQRLGTLELPETEDTDGVDLFRWASQAIGQRDGLRGEVSSLEGQTKTQDETMASLQKQIDELVEAKAEHEKQMLSKFALLLNEKKLKIRKMERIMSTARVDPKKLKELEAEIGDETVSAVSRKKRAADDEAEKEEAEDSDTFETMDVDPVKTIEKEPDSPQSGNTTPTASEAEESDEDNMGGSAESSNMSRRAMGAPPAREQSSKQGKHAIRKPEPAPTTNDDDEETASEDSEL